MQYGMDSNVSIMLDYIGFKFQVCIDPLRVERGSSCLHANNLFYCVLCTGTLVLSVCSTWYSTCLQHCIVLTWAGTVRLLQYIGHTVLCPPPKSNSTWKLVIR